MLRSDLLAAVEQVNFVLRTSQVSKVLAPTEARNLGAFLGAFQALSKLEDQLSEPAREMIRILDLEPIFSAQYWQGLMAPEASQNRDLFMTMRVNVRNALSLLPKFAALLARSSDSIESSVTSDLDSQPQYVESKLTLLLPEVDRLSSPKRIVIAMEAVSNLYEVVCRLMAENESTLAVASCDSGSDKIFDFTGIDGVLREVKELLLGVWDRVALHRTNRADAELGQIEKALPIIVDIEKRKSDGSIGAEDAELLKRKVISALKGIKESGAIVFEAKDRYRTIDVRALAAPSPRLLAGPAEPGEVISERDDIGSVDDLDDAP